MYNAFCRGRCPHRPGRMHVRNEKRCGEIEGSQWAGVGIGPDNVRKEVQRIWEV